MLLFAECNESHNDCHKNYDTFVILLLIISILVSAISALLYCYFLVQKQMGAVIKSHSESQKTICDLKKYKGLQSVRLQPFIVDVYF